MGNSVKNNGSQIMVRSDIAASVNNDDTEVTLFEFEVPGGSISRTGRMRLELIVEETTGPAPEARTLKLYWGGDYYEFVSADTPPANETLKTRIQVDIVYQDDPNLAFSISSLISQLQSLAAMGPFAIGVDANQTLQMTIQYAIADVDSTFRVWEARLLIDP